MYRYFLVLFTFFIVNVVSRHIPYSTREHTNRSVCEGQLLTRACKHACLTQQLKPLCTISAVHVCICEYPEDMMGNEINEDRIAVIIKLANLETANDEITDSESVSEPQAAPTAPPNNNDSNLWKEVAKDLIDDSPLMDDPASRNNATKMNSAYTNYSTPNDPVSEKAPEETALTEVYPQPEHVPDYPGHNKVVWTESGFQKDIPKDTFPQPSQESRPELKHIKENSFETDRTNQPSQVIEETGMQNDEQAIEEKSMQNNEPVHDKEQELVSVDNQPVDYDLTSATPSYKKYFVETDLRSLVTSQTFIFSVAFVYISIAIIFCYLRSYRRNRYIRIPLMDCSEKQTPMH